MRLLSQILFLTIFPLLIVLSYNYYQNLHLEKILNERLEQKIDIFSLGIKKELENKKVAAQKTSHLLSNSELVIQAFEKRDIDFLYTRATMFIQSNVISEIVFVDNKGIVLSRASDEYKFNDTIKDTELEFILNTNTPTTLSKLIYFDHKYQLISIRPIFKYDIHLLGYVIASHIIDKEFLNSLSTEKIYLEFHKESKFINNFDAIIEDSFDTFTKVQISNNLDLYLNVEMQQKEILEHKTKQNYIIIFLLILSTVFILFFVGKVLQPFNKLNKLLLDFSSKETNLKDLIHKIKLNKNSYNELSEIQHSIVLALEKLESTQEELLKSNAKTIHANQLKDKFLSNMSHKIRTPMNEIISYLNVLEESETDTKQKKYIAKTFKATESLSEVINNILDIAKIESGDLIFNQHYISFKKLIKECNKNHTNLAEQKQLDFIIKIDPKIELLKLYVDQVRFLQAIGNIIDNAIKYTDSGFVKVEFNIINKYSDTIDIEIIISDTGIGMRQNDLDKIFDSFTVLNSQQIQSSTYYLGAGLGLSISRHIINLMQGKIEVSSKLTKGSTFTLNIPNIKYK